MSIFDNLIKSLKSFILFLIHKFTYRPAEVFAFACYMHNSDNSEKFEFYVKGHDCLGIPTTLVIDEDSMKAFAEFYYNRFSKEYKTQKSEKELNNSTSAEELL